jgi:hypothetical protein
MSPFRKQKPATNKVQSITIKDSDGRIFLLVAKPLPAGKPNKDSRIEDRHLREWRASGVVSAFRTISADDSCQYCKDAERFMFPIQLSHPLPHAGCTHPYGCRCTLIPISDVDEFEEL